MKKCLILFAASIFFLSGCEFKDIDKRLFVVAIGFDEPEDPKNNIKIALKVAIPQGNPKQGNQQFDIIEVESETIAAALRLAKSKVDKELDYGHAKTIIIGAKVARTKYWRHIIDWSSRRRDIQQIASVAIGQPTALDVMKLKPKTERIPANALYLALSKDGSESPYFSPQFLFDIHRRMTEIGLDPYLPIVEVNTDNYQKFEISSMALFNKDNLVVTLSPEESKLFTIIQHTEDVRVNYTVHSNESVYDINVERISSQYSFVRNGTLPSIHWKVSFVGFLEERNAGEDMNPNKLRMVEQEGEQALTKQVTSLLSKLQKNKVDPLGFGLRYVSRSWNNQNETERWQELYESMKFHVDSKINIKYTGVTQ